MREVYAVRWRKDAGRWVCPQLNLGGENKTELIQELARRLNRRWKIAHILCQLRIYNRNGRINSERTYGKDPRKSRG